MIYRRDKIEMAAKYADFYGRVRKYRPDARGISNPHNPATDYYGEEIMSVSGYRTWLRAQRDFKNGKRRPLRLRLY